MTDTLRIIGGEWRGRRIRFPGTAGIRPTPDRVRETLFNWLAAVVPGSRCLDLFAGSGGLGLEALSRGAREATFVERDRRNAARLSETVALLAPGRAAVVVADALAWLAGPATARAALDASGADAVMIGRGAYGAPWMPQRIARYLATGRDPGPPPLVEQGAIAVAHVEAMLGHHGRDHGLKMARKHIGWYLAGSGRRPDAVKAWRRALCTSDDHKHVLGGLRTFYAQAQELAA